MMYVTDFNSRFKRAYFLLSKLGCKSLFAIALRRCFGLNHYYILGARIRALTLEKRTRLDYSLRKAFDVDFDELIKSMPSLKPNDRREIMIRIYFYLAGFKNCYVARDKHGRICYIQWIVYPDENEYLKRWFREDFYLLNENQVMIENAFTFPRYRGLGLLSSVTMDLLGKAEGRGYRSIVAHIRKDNFAPLNEFISLGFKIRNLVKEYKFLGLVRRTL